MTLALLLGALPLVACAVWLGLRFPYRGPVALYAAIVPFGSSLRVQVGLPPPFNTVSTLLGLVSIVALAAQLVSQRARTSRLLAAIPIFLLFVGLSAGSWFWSVNPSATVRNLYVLLSQVALFSLIGLVRAAPDDLRAIERAIIAGGCLVAGYGVFLLASGSLAATADGVTRFATAGGVGEDADPNITAAAMLLPLVLIMTRLVRSRSAVRACGAAAALVVVLAAIILTGSRGGLLAAMAGITTVLALERGRDFFRIAVPIVLVAAVAYGAAPASVQERFNARNTTAGADASTGRSEVWRVGLRGCQQHCLDGSGYGTFPDVYQKTLLSDLGLKGHGLKPFEAHNIWLSMVVEVGLAGLLLAIAGIASLLRDVRRLPRALRTAPLAAIVAVVMANLFLSNFDFKYFWLVLTYAAMVVLAGPARVPSDEVHTPEVHPSPRPLAFAGGA